MELADAHCHFDFPVFDGQREDILARARARGITRIVIPGVRRKDWSRVAQTAASSDALFYCLGIHPWFIEEHDERDLVALESALSASSGRCVGVGECGLDRIHGAMADQMAWFEAQVRIAMRLSLPLAIHSVRAHDEVHGVLRTQGFRGRALVHGFAGSYEQACKLIDLGCFIGVGGVITHARAQKTRSAIARLPLSALVLETDAPDMPPQGVPNGGNSPENLPFILTELAALRGESEAALAPQLLENTRTLYGLPESV